MKKVGKDFASVNCRRIQDYGDHAVVVEGTKISDRGYLSPILSPIQRGWEGRSRDACILIHEKKISSMRTRSPYSSRLPRPVSRLIIAETLWAKPGYAGREQIARHPSLRSRKGPGFGETAARPSLRILLCSSACGGHKNAGSSSRTSNSKISDAQAGGRSTKTTPPSLRAPEKRTRSARIKQLRTQIEDTTLNYDKEKV